MVYGVKSFFRINKKDVKVGVLVLVLNRIVKLTIEVPDVVISRPSWDKALLAWVQDLGELRPEEVCEHFGDDAIVGVGHRDWAGVVDEQRVVLGQQEEGAVIEAGWRCPARGEQLENSEQYWRNVFGCRLHTSDAAAVHVGVSLDALRLMLNINTIAF